MMVDFMLWSRLGPCWSTTCFEASWSHAGRLCALEYVGPILADYVFWSRLGPCWLTTYFEACSIHIGWLHALVQVSAMLANFVLWSMLGLCWPTTCFEASWGHVGRIRAFEHVGAVSSSVDKQSKMMVNWIEFKFFPNKIHNKYNWQNGNLMNICRKLNAQLNMKVKE